MIIKKLPLGPIEANTYIIFDKNSRDTALVEVSGDAQKIKQELDTLGANLKYILLTHGHFDHVFAVNDLKKLYPQAKVFLNKEDEVLTENIAAQCSHFGIAGIEKPKIDDYADENTTLSLGDIKIKVIHTPGHSKGSVCYLAGNDLFSGDTLFFEEIGRCDLFGGSFPQIEKSIREKIFTLDKDIIVHPGHGEDTSVAHEVKYNAYFGENSRY
ncbi:TPA: MBL fold metallo-hydrolase [Candidatus Galligastranaerophilus faecipullorum]|nr:MBL fold metallo-hydrolase [Candidatus Galligastranaerophilus faecipullorum]